MGSNFLWAQQKYWVTFEDKPSIQTSPASWCDTPINPSYLQQIESLGPEIICQSKWLNAVSVLLDSAQHETIKALSFVKATEVIDPHLQILSLPESDLSAQPLHYGYALEQINASVLAEKKLNGKGVTIGVIDAGFWKAPRNRYLKELFQKGQVTGYKDFVFDDDPETFFDYRRTSSDAHGTTVLRMIAGKKAGDRQYGMADQATFFLARTDHGDKEFRGEEDYWIAAIEWLDSLGVKLVNTSLGYSIGYDNPKENYKISDMDGKTTMISKAANIAAKERGMLIIVSAGNEGDKESWKILSAPADAEHVLSIGATQRNGLKADYSSIGPQHLPYLKPNLSCYSLYGTSFSAPVITGLAACLWQYKPEATASEIKKALEQSGQLYPFGNNFIGYGVPIAQNALNILDGHSGTDQAMVVSTTKKSFIVEEHLLKETIILFHKKDATNVLKQEAISTTPLRKRLKVRKYKNAQRTTIVSGKSIIEVIWE
ncbi:S8 family serine peptidase [Algivirga pacifica]|uniref:S8 family serine peptidase n=2 Tax=Algivirga pacifica TaxID=1162670 RepID=A0ABP9CZP4_9BACT